MDNQTKNIVKETINKFENASNEFRLKNLSNIEILILGLLDNSVMLNKLLLAETENLEYTTMPITSPQGANILFCPEARDITKSVIYNDYIHCHARKVKRR